MRLLLGMLRPDAGEVRLDGVDAACRGCRDVGARRTARRAPARLRRAHGPGQPRGRRPAARRRASPRRRRRGSRDRRSSTSAATPRCARAGSRWATASGSASPPRCCTSRRSSCSTSRRTASTRPASSCCANRSCGAPTRAPASSCRATTSTRSHASPIASRVINDGRVIGTLDPGGRRPRAGVLRARARRRRGAERGMSAAAGAAADRGVRSARVARAALRLAGSAPPSPSRRARRGRRGSWSRRPCILVAGIGALAARDALRRGIRRRAGAREARPARRRRRLGRTRRDRGADHRGRRSRGVRRRPELDVRPRVRRRHGRRRCSRCPVSRAAIALAKLVVYASGRSASRCCSRRSSRSIGLRAWATGRRMPQGSASSRACRCSWCSPRSSPCPRRGPRPSGADCSPGSPPRSRIIVVAQVLAIADVGEWVPIVAPALWAIAPDSVPAAALLTVPSVPLVFGALCALAWSRMQLDR